MASDSKLRPFLLFIEFVWSNPKILSPDDIIEFYGSGCLTETDLEEISDPSLHRASLTVRYFYDCIFRNSINNNETKYPKSGEESCNYIKRMCNDESWFGRPTIFERCFATISFVLTCSEYTEEAFSDIRRNAHVSWAKYFYEYRKEFYNEGGWKKLRRTADSYAKVHDLIRIVNPAQDSLDFIKLSKSVENYMFFCSIRKFIPEDNNKSKIIEGIKDEYGKNKTCSNLWIKFKVKKGKSTSFLASFTQFSKSPSEVTCLLRALRYFCDPYGFKVDHSKLSSDPGLPQKPSSAAIYSPGRNQESCTKKENDRKGEPQSRYFYKDSNFNEPTGQETSNSIIRKVSLQNTAVEKGCEIKDTKIENFTGGENDRTDNVPYTSSMPVKMWKKVQGKRNRKTERLQVFNKSLQLGEEMKQASSNSIINSVLQNTAIEKESKDIGKENLTRGQNDGMNVPYTSSMVGEMLKKPNKRQRNRNQVELRDFNKSLDNKATRQESSIIYSVPLQNTEVGNEHKDSGKKNFTGENHGKNNLPYIAGEMWRKTKGKMSRKKAGLQVLDKSLELGEATRQASSNSFNNNFPRQNTAVGKESDKGNIGENVAGGENDKTS